MRIVIEAGPKGKKFVAFAVDWPGLERNGKTPEAAAQQIDSYRSRYQRVADRAELGDEYSAEPASSVCLEYEGVGSTDFWGVSFAHSEFDHEPLSSEELERQLTLLQACWAEFDDIALRVSENLRKGPRGGGRDRDHIVRHVLAAELDWVRKLGIRLPLEDVVESVNRRAFHGSILDAVRDHHADDRIPKVKGGTPWTIRFMIRHLAYHVMDHAWEMEDKDLSSPDS